MADNDDNNSSSTTSSSTTPTKVVNKDYLYTQFQRFYNQVARPDVEALEAELVKITQKLNRIVQVCANNNITIDFSDIDNPTSSEN